MAHGLGAIKALRLAAFAERFQAAGYACLVFDYRHFGDSEGEPRELLSISRQREDWRAAVASPARCPTSTRIALCCGARRSAAVTRSPPPPPTTPSSPRSRSAPSPTASPRPGRSRRWAVARLAVAAAKDQLARLLGRPPVRVKVAARPGEVGLMDAPDVIEGVIGLLEASGLTEAEYRNDVPARVALEIPLDAPGRGRRGSLPDPLLRLRRRHRRTGQGHPPPRGQGTPRRDPPLPRRTLRHLHRRAVRTGRHRPTRLPRTHVPTPPERSRRALFTHGSSRAPRSRQTRG